MPFRPGIILQARLASQRLPGKALVEIGGQSILEHCLRRLIASGTKVVLATTQQPDDDALAAVATRLNVAVFRGDEHDVLRRYLRCAEQFRLDPVLRATADNPGVDMLAPSRVLAALIESGADYLREEGLPCGAAVEGVRTSALATADVLAREAYDREHVTTYIRRHTDGFRVVERRAPAALTAPDLRLTIDTPEDLSYVRELFARAGGDMPSLTALIDAAGPAVKTEVA
jgi:spore coat polysaccharide biosynthesis protein SpsF